MSGEQPTRGVALNEAVTVFTVTAALTVVVSVQPFGDVAIKLTLNVPDEL
ncbi:MAG: hypothetical protein BWY67_01423 [Bacteroidetes bacterium ADurb.Bin397]|nr:MAG: hypothetical protein BWY67_01423 [Bacteroidetes bacterium ADurb.Bin397]